MDLIIEALLDTLRTALGQTVTTYVTGRADADRALAKSTLPLLAVIPITTRRTRGGTGNDDEEFDVAILVALSVRSRSSAGNTRNAARIRTQRDITAMVEGHDADGSRLPGSITSILDQDLTLGGKALYTDNFSIDYDSDLSDDSRQASTESALLRFTVYTRPPRG